MTSQQLPPSSSDYHVPTQPQVGDRVLGPGLFLRDGIQYGEGLPQHLVGTAPVALGKRVLFTLANGLCLYAIGWIIEKAADLLGLPQMDPASGSYMDWGGLLSFCVSLGLFIYYMVTGWMLPLGPLFKIRQVRVRTRSAPGWAGLGKYVLNGLLFMFLIFPYLIVVFGTRDEVQRHAVDRASGIIVLDVGRGIDPLANK